MNRHRPVRTCRVVRNLISTTCYVRRVYPTEHSRIHRVLWKSPARGAVRRPAVRRAAGPAAGSRPPSRRGRSRSACIANGRLRYTGDGRRPDARRGVSYPVSDSMSCRRRARVPVPRRQTPAGAEDTSSRDSLVIVIRCAQRRPERQPRLHRLLLVSGFVRVFNAQRRPERQPRLHRSKTDRHPIRGR